MRRPHSLMIYSVLFCVGCSLMIEKPARLGEGSDSERYADTDSDTDDDADADTDTDTDTECADGVPDTEGVCIHGWREDFDVPQYQLLTAYDSRWTPIFGTIELLPLPEYGAAFGDEGSEDGGDDYAYRAVGTPTGSVEITMDFYWGGWGGAGALVAVQDAAPHEYYEAGLLSDSFVIGFYQGGDSSNVSFVEQYYMGEVAAGFYRLVFEAIYTDNTWQMSATLQDPAANFGNIVSINAIDANLGPGRQGIGIWRNDSSRSNIISISVTPL